MVGAGKSAPAPPATAGAESAEVRKVSIYAGYSGVSGAECSAGSAEWVKPTLPHRPDSVRPPGVRFGQLAQKRGWEKCCRLGEGARRLRFGTSSTVPAAKWNLHANKAESARTSESARCELPALDGTREDPDRGPVRSLHPVRPAAAGQEPRRRSASSTGCAPSASSRSMAWRV
jgi:hypothetical protein